MKEWSLVAFTLLTQLAIGMVVMLSAMQWLPALVEQASGLSALLPYFYGVGVVVMSVALVASFLHLGTPTRAWRSLAHWRSSWLSREVVLALTFSSLCAARTVLGRFAPPTLVVQLIEGAAVGNGLLLLYAMAKVYRLRSIAVWKSWTTLGQFVLSSALLGSLSLGLLLLANDRTYRTTPQQLLGGLTLCALLSLVFALALAVGQRLAPPALPRGHLEIDVVPAASTARTFLWRCIAMVGALVCLSGLWLTDMGVPAAGVWLAIAAILTLLSEILGRLLFYTHAT